MAVIAEVEQVNSKETVVEVSIDVLLILLSIFSPYLTFHLNLSSLHPSRFWTGGGSYFNDGSDVAVSESFSTTEKVGKSDGYVIIRMKVPDVGGPGLGAPGPGPVPGPVGKSGKKEEKAKSGKLTQGTLFT